MLTPLTLGMFCPILSQAEPVLDNTQALQTFGGATSCTLLAHRPFLRAFQAPAWNLQPIQNCTGVAQAHLSSSSRGKPRNCSLNRASQPGMMGRTMASMKTGSVKAQLRRRSLRQWSSSARLSSAPSALYHNIAASQPSFKKKGASVHCFGLLVMGLLCSFPVMPQ